MGKSPANRAARREKFRIIREEWERMGVFTGLFKEPLTLQTSPSHNGEELWSNLID